MLRTSQKLLLTALTVAAMAATAAAQNDQYKEMMSVQGRTGAVTVLQSRGHVFVDLNELAMSTGGSVDFQHGRIVLTIPQRPTANLGSEDTNDSRFSPAFVSAAIETMASIRQWGGLVMTTVQNGYPIGNNFGGNTIAEYQARAADAVALASAAAATDADQRGLELLKTEFSAVQDWTERFVAARRSLSAAKLTTSENALHDDEEAQRALRCGQSLAQMFANGTMQDNDACR